MHSNNSTGCRKNAEELGGGVGRGGILHTVVTMQNQVAAVVHSAFHSALAGAPTVLVPGSV